MTILPYQCDTIRYTKIYKREFKSPPQPAYTGFRSAIAKVRCSHGPNSNPDPNPNLNPWL